MFRPGLQWVSGRALALCAGLSLLLPACGGESIQPFHQDSTPPTVRVIAPAPDAQISAPVEISAEAHDDIGIGGVQFLLDGAALEAEDLVAPYAVWWDSSTASKGAHTLAARARDRGGNVATSSDVPVVVVGAPGEPPRLVINRPSEGASIVGSEVAIEYDTTGDLTGVDHVHFELDGGPLAMDMTLDGVFAFSDVAQGAHTLSGDLVRADHSAIEGSNASVSFSTVLPDTIAPNVAITEPASGSAVSGAIGVSADATDDVGVAGVEFSLDGAALGPEVVTPPFSVTWDTLTASNGMHALIARAHDAAGNFGTSAEVDVTVQNEVPDTVPPTVAVTAPTAGTQVTATVEVSASASDNVGVTGVQFLLDGADLDAEDVGAPYAVSWNSTSATNGEHVLTARARDAAGNLATSAPVAITVANVPKLVITSPPEGAALVGATVPIQYVTSGDLTGVTQVHFQLDGGPLAMDTTLDGSFELTGVAAGAHTLAGVLARADHSAIVGSGDVVSFSNTVPDTTPPSVALTAPADGASISGTINVSADASDNVGVSGVQFLLDGTALGQEDMATPYALTWDSRIVANGSHTLAARARDAAGNVSTSAVRSIQVTNASIGGSFKNEILLTGLTLPTVLKFLPDGKMLIAELGGRVVVLRPGATAVDVAPFLQLSNIGTLNGQQGIMDIVLDPAFSTNGHYYVFYTLGTPNRDRVSRFTASGLTTQLATETLVWQDDADAHEEHHGGALTFASDGKLYITTGEHFDAPLAQSLQSYRGKILRLNRDGTVPTDNPFFDGAGPNKDAIWALGLRNPYRAFYDTVSGRLYVGDVGGNDVNTAVEELNLAVRGANYGWPDCEGPCNDARYTDPLYSYPHDGRDAAITAGFVYRGTQFPSQYQGNFFFGDYAQNWIKRLLFGSGGNVTEVANFEPPDGALDGPTGDIVYMAQGPDGALYYVDLGFSDVTNVTGISKIRRISFAAGNAPPIALASATPSNGTPPLSVAFTSSGSRDPEGAALTFAWDFGDGASSTAANPTHVYTARGRYLARLGVSDGVNTRLADPLTIDVGARPLAAILTPANGRLFRAGETVAFTGDAVDDEDGTLPASAFSWQTNFRHSTHVHPGVPLTATKSGSLVIPTSGHDFSGTTWYEIALTVTDSHGLQDSKSVSVYPDKVNVSFNSVPSGLTLYLDGLPRTTPFVYDTLIGFQHVVEAPSQMLGGYNYAFGSWSDGGSAQHAITVGPSSQTFTATFNQTSVSLPSGLVAAYNLNETSGTTAADRSGNNNTATLFGGPSRTPGRYGNALAFDDVDDYLSVPNSASLDIAGTGLTLAFWISPQPTGGADTVVIGKFWNAAGMAAPFYQYGVELSSGVEPQLFIGTNTGPQSASMGLFLAFGQWTHLAITFDGTAARFYVNGALVTTEPLSASIVARGNPLGIGADDRPQQFYVGLLDEVRIYQRALSLAEVQADMQTAF